MKAEDLVRQIEEKLGTSRLSPAWRTSGRVMSVADGIVRADGLSRAGYGELVEFADGRRGLVMNLDEDSASILALSEDTTSRKAWRSAPRACRCPSGSPRPARPGDRSFRRAPGRQAPDGGSAVPQCRWKGSPRG